MEDNNDAKFRALCYIAYLKRLAPKYPFVNPTTMTLKRMRTQRQKKKTSSDGVISILSLPVSAPSGFNLIIEKKIFATDISLNHGRLSIPFAQVKTHDFLTAEEKELIMEEENRVITVSLFLPWLNISEEMSFGKWKMGNSFIYRLGGNWSNIIRCNIFNVGDEIQVWSFRNNSRQLCLALIKKN